MRPGGLHSSFDKGFNKTGSAPGMRLNTNCRYLVFSWSLTISSSIVEQSICPPREVRNFRVLVVKDACTVRRPSYRRAQITVWDVLGLLLSEGSDGGNFQEDQRFKVTNLMPTQQRAWMNRDRGSEVYLCTRRDSRWTKIR